MKLTHASVFSGIGGPEIAATMLGWDNVFHCEINEFGRKILEYWYPNSKSYEDITKTDFTEWRGRVNVLTGGFPCQPFSYAGQRRGENDDRYLWPYMFRCIDQIQPTWVVAENVAGITTMVEQGEVSPMESQESLFDEVDAVRRYRLRETFTLQRICDDLEGRGYEVQPVLVPACAVGAPHRRDRVFIIGHRVATDSYERADRRAAREDEGKGREERIQERHEVREPHQPSEVRRESEGYASADTDNLGRGEWRSETDGREHDNLQAQVFGIAEGYGIGRPTADTDSARQSTPNWESGRERKEMDGWRESIALDGSFGLGTPSASSDTRDGIVPDSERVGWYEGKYDDGFFETAQQGERGKIKPRGTDSPQDWWRAFPTVSPVHRGNDGLPFSLDDLAIPASKWRTESLKAYGNAIVPQVMYEIFRAIEIVERDKNQ